MSNSIYIIGDVHGSVNTLRALIAKLPVDAKIVFVGDLIDRGPYSSEVVRLVRENGYDCVMGNHCSMMLKDVKVVTESNGEKTLELNTNGIWLPNGGGTTLNNYIAYGEQDLDMLSILEKDLEWMAKLPLYKEYPDIVNDKGQHLVVSHSSAAEFWKCRNLADPYETFQNLILWDRPTFPKKIDKIFNVFGHSPINKPHVFAHWANIDTGCVFDGFLTALQFPEMVIHQQPKVAADR